MLVEERQRTLAPSSLHPCVTFKENHRFILTIVIFLCKLIVLIGLLVTTFSNRWAKSPNSQYVHAGKSQSSLVFQQTLERI